MSVFFLASCNNDDDFVPVDYSDAAFGMVINVNPSSELLYFYADNNLIGSGGALSYNRYYPYWPFYTGERTLRILGTMTNFELDSVEMVAGQSYSILAVKSETSDSAEIAVYQDNFTLPAGGKAGIRFIHASPDAGEINVIVNENTAASHTLTYKEATDFYDVDAGTLNFEIKNTEDESLLVSPGQNLTAGRVYTILIRGYSESWLSEYYPFSTGTVLNY